MEKGFKLSTIKGQRDPQGRKLFILEEDVEVEMVMGLSITIPKGYVSNFATIPRFFYRIVSPSEIADEAITHDYLCGESYLLDECETVPGLDNCHRWFADRWLLTALLKNKFISKRRALFVYAGVRFWAIVTGRFLK